jgi:amino acid transporter
MTRMIQLVAILALIVGFSVAFVYKTRHLERLKGQAQQELRKRIVTLVPLVGLAVAALFLIEWLLKLALPANASALMPLLFATLMLLLMAILPMLLKYIQVKK